MVHKGTSNKESGKGGREAAIKSVIVETANTGTSSLLDFFSIIITLAMIVIIMIMAMIIMNMIINYDNFHGDY